MKEKKDLIVITGTDSGIGKNLSEVFMEHGYPVLATYYEKPGTRQSINIKLDLRNETEREALVQKVSLLMEEGYCCKCLINNAGIACGGPIENLPLSIYRETLEVNLIGLIHITRGLIPFLAGSRGLIILHGSAAGRVAAPFLSPYVITKFALEGFADCLRRELLPYGISTVLLETGGVDTPIWKKAENQDLSFVDKKYSKSMELFKKNFIQGKKGLTARTASEKIFHIFEKKKHKPRYIIARSILREYVIRMISGRILDGVFQKMFDMDYGG
jgi:short-subunit dehydrogenase